MYSKEYKEILLQWLSMEEATQSKNKKSEPEFVKKRDISYQKCLQELCNPCEGWEDILEAAKNEVLPS